jgi:hypothetical protein
MDENDMRMVLGRLAEAEGPPPRINVGQAINRGRRGRRLRMMTTAGGSTGASRGTTLRYVAAPSCG